MKQWKGGFMMKNENGLKILGLLVALAGLGIQLLSDYVNERRQDEIIDEKITKRLSEGKNEN